ncbi:hypothetical protein IWQ60_001210 [Tieghemiomyces parasiticus]|uniref:Uncharacterized protein n=1 Tax=Tieghemiomyces parasiticus TaxID=78921 RepID=A0A9W8AF32_9FUNG|nr:hypothetical protein IWQ60_001210 [Tieghemiomyces parasiticus]
MSAGLRTRRQGNVRRAFPLTYARVNAVLRTFVDLKAWDTPLPRKELVYMSRRALEANVRCLVSHQQIMSILTKVHRVMSARKSTSEPWPLIPGLKCQCPTEAEQSEQFCLFNEWYTQRAASRDPAPSNDGELASSQPDAGTPCPTCTARPTESAAESALTGEQPHNATPTRYQCTAMPASSNSENVNPSGLMAEEVRTPAVLPSPSHMIPSGQTQVNELIYLLSAAHDDLEVRRSQQAEQFHRILERVTRQFQDTVSQEGQRFYDRFQDELMRDRETLRTLLCDYMASARRDVREARHFQRT